MAWTFGQKEGQWKRGLPYGVQPYWNLGVQQNRKCQHLSEVASSRFKRWLEATSKYSMCPWRWPDESRKWINMGVLQQCPYRYISLLNPLWPHNASKNCSFCQSETTDSHVADSLMGRPSSQLPSQADTASPEELQMGTSGNRHWPWTGLHLSRRYKCFKYYERTWTQDLQIWTVNHHFSIPRNTLYSPWQPTMSRE